MKPIFLEVTITEQLLTDALPYLRESMCLARRRRTNEYHSKYRWFPLTLGVVLLPVSMLGLVLALVMATFGPVESWWRDVALSVFFAAGLAVGIAIVVYHVQNRESPFANVTDQLSRWTINRSVNRLLKMVPYVAKYRLDDENLEAKIDALKISRQIPLEKVPFAYSCDHLFAPYTGGYIHPLRWIYVNTPEQHKEVAAVLHAAGVEIVPLKLADGA